MTVKYRVTIFEKAARKVSRDRGCCYSLTEVGANRYEHALLQKMHKPRTVEEYAWEFDKYGNEMPRFNDTWWFGKRFQKRNIQLRKQCLREIAYLIRTGEIE